MAPTKKQKKREHHLENLMARKRGDTQMDMDKGLPEELQHPEIIFIPKLLLTYKEAAQCTGLSVATLESLVSQGKLPIVKIGKSARFRVADLREFAEKNLIRKNR